MKTLSQNTTSSVSAPETDLQLVATIVPDEQRISFWPQHFGLIPQWVTLEPRVFGWMDRLCEDYCGGIWNLYTQLVATIVPDEQRISFWPQHFGLIPQWVTLEPRVFGWMDRLCEDYCGGIWNLYTLNNGGAFMAPEPDDDDDETSVRHGNG